MSGGRRLTGHVHVRDERGRPHVFGPVDDVPAWAFSKIRNPAAWADDEPPAAPPPVVPTAQQTPVSGTSTPPQPDTGDETAGVIPAPGPAPAPAVEPGTGPSDADEPPGPPPRGGSGSGTDAWAVYADRVGVEIADRKDRGAIIAAITAAGHPVD